MLVEEKIIGKDLAFIAYDKGFNCYGWSAFMYESKWHEDVCTITVALRMLKCIKMTAEQKAIMYANDMEGEVSCGMYHGNKFRDGYIAGYNEATRWIPFEEKEPPLNTTILVKGGLLWDDLSCEGNEYEFATVRRTRIGERDVFVYYVTNEVYASAWVGKPIYWMMIPD